MSRKMPAVMFVVFVLFLLIVSSVSAGIGYTLKCSHCGFTEELSFGEGMISKVIADGYCCHCHKFVAIRRGTGKDEKGLYQNYDGVKWTTMTEEEAKAMEEPIGYVYCPDSEGQRALYPCPVCGKPFVQIKEEDLGAIDSPVEIYCPKCGKKTLQRAPGCDLWD